MAKTRTGLEENIASLLCYLLGWITGLIFIIIEKENKTVRFHALQAIIVFGSLFVLNIILGVIPIIGWLILFLLNILGFILWIIFMVKAYKGEKIKLPIAGEIAEKYS